MSFNNEKIKIVIFKYLKSRTVNQTIFGLSPNNNILFKEFTEELNRWDAGHEWTWDKTQHS